MLVAEPSTGEVVADHAAGRAGRGQRPRRALRRDPAGQADAGHRGPKTAAEKAFLALGAVAEAFLLGAAAAGDASCPGELAEILALRAAHGEPALLAALERAVAFRRWRADDVRSILAAAGAAPDPRPAGQALVLDPAARCRPGRCRPTRSADGEWPQ